MTKYLKNGKIESVFVYEKKNPTHHHHHHSVSLAGQGRRSGIEKIPFVHLRSDMELWELDYFIKDWGTEVFNIHTRRDYPILAQWQKYKRLIYIENTYKPFNEEEIKEFAGVCLDFSHLENNRLFYPETYRRKVSSEILLSFFGP